MTYQCHKEYQGAKYLALRQYKARYKRGFADKTSGIHLYNETCGTDGKWGRVGGGKGSSSQTLTARAKAAARGITMKRKKIQKRWRHGVL